MIVSDRATGARGEQQNSVPRSGGENQRKSEAGQASVAGRRDELAADTLRETAVDASVLTLLAAAVGVEGLELPVQRLGLLAV